MPERGWNKWLLNEQTDVSLNKHEGPVFTGFFLCVIKMISSASLVCFHYLEGKGFI